MSSAPLPLIDLEFLPDWAHPTPSQTPSRYAGDESPLSGNRDPVRETRRSANRPLSGRGRKREGKGGAGHDRHHDVRGTAPRLPVSVVPQVEVGFLPEPRALQSVGEQIRITSRAYPLFSLAKMFLDKPERHLVRLELKNDPKGDPPPLLNQCAHCGNVSLNEMDATVHALKKHRQLYYEERREQADAPRGNFTSVARCRLNGAILGPTNHHAYQSNLMQLYKAQFRHLPFSRFKESVVSVHDPEVIRKWQEKAAWKITYNALNVPQPTTLSSESQIEQHFRETHFGSAVRRERSVVADGEACRHSDDTEFLAAVRRAWEIEIRFPLNMARHLREEFVKMGLQIFKGRKGMQFVSVARPKPLIANAADVSKTVSAILEFIKSHPGCNRKILMDALAPPASHPAATPVSPEETSSPAHAAASLVLQDLHWLARQGHVVEYNNGHLEVTLPPSPKPVKPAAPAPSKATTQPAEK